MAVHSTNRKLIDMGIIMHALNDIYDLAETDPVGAHDLRDKLYSRLVHDIAVEGERMKKLDMVEMMKAALHAEELIKPCTMLNGLARPKIGQ